MTHDPIAAYHRELEKIENEFKLPAKVKAEFSVIDGGQDDGAEQGDDAPPDDGWEAPNQRSDDRATDAELVPAAVDVHPLDFIDPTEWEGTEAPPRRWLVRNRLPAGAVCLLQGDGAAGKTTIALQLMVATLRGTDWLGAVIDTSGTAMMLTAEEDGEEIHRRLGPIVRHQGTKFSDLGGLHVHCIPGEDAVLGLAGKDGIVRATPLFLRLELSARQVRPALIVIEAAADVFAGNENDRSQVRQFIGLLRRLAINSGATVLLLAHPSLSGLASGSGTSGSTGWNNSVRSRLYFSSVKSRDADGDEPELDVRQLQVMKSNYGPAGEIVNLRWRDGVFVPDGAPGSLAQIAAEAQVDDVFLRCLDAKTAQGIDTSHKQGRNHAPKIFAAMPEAGGLKARAFEKAMERLLSAGRIRVTEVGPKSRTHIRLVRTEQWTTS